MFNKFFENPNNLTQEQLQALQEEKKQQEAHAEEERQERQRQLQVDKMAISVFEQLQEYLENEKIKLTQAKFKDELITLNIGGYDFSKDGFPYSYFLVGKDNAGAIVDVDYMGIRYQVELKEGLNAVNFAPNTVLKSNEPIVLGLFKTDYKLI